MNTLLSPNNYGKKYLTEECQKININDFVRRASLELKKNLIKSQFSAQGIDVELITSSTAFGGERIWFKCSSCNGRVGTLYLTPDSQDVACRTCLNLDYRSHRYNNMLELKA